MSKSGAFPTQTSVQCFTRPNFNGFKELYSKFETFKLLASYCKLVGLELRLLDALGIQLITANSEPIDFNLQKSHSFSTGAEVHVQMCYDNCVTIVLLLYCHATWHIISTDLCFPRRARQGDSIPGTRYTSMEESVRAVASRVYPFRILRCRSSRLLICDKLHYYRVGSYRQILEWLLGAEFHVLRGGKHRSRWLCFSRLRKLCIIPRYTQLLSSKS